MGKSNICSWLGRLHIFLFISIFIAVLATSDCRGLPGPRFDVSPLPETEEVTFVICGDTRVRLSPLRTSKHVEREEISRKIAELRPALVLNSGDLVGAGSNWRTWRKFDELTQPIRDAGIRYLPALGNHEYWGSNEVALDAYFERFPELNRARWYAYDAGPLRLIILDSNFDELGAELQASQRAWLEQELKKATADPGVSHVLLVFHHPPYTNGKHDPSLQGRKQFVEPARAHPKVRGVISGHVHSYERFKIDGWAYVVSGGGGAPLYDVETDPDKMRTVPIFKGPPRRGHHYIECVVTRERITCTVHEVEDKTLKWSVLDRFTIE